MLGLALVKSYTRCFGKLLRKSCLFTHAADMEPHEHPAEVVFLFTTVFFGSAPTPEGDIWLLLYKMLHHVYKLVANFAC